MKRDSKTLADELAAFGAPRHSVVSLDGPAQPDHVPYLDLVQNDATAGRPDAVVEMQGRPVLFVVHGRANLQLPPLQRALALRADGSFLGVVEPGRLTVYSPSLVPKDAALAIKVAEKTDLDAADVIPELALLPPPTSDHEETHQLLFRLFDHATTTIARSGLSPDDALSLAGRAVFLRFLADRRVVRERDVPDVCDTATSFVECFNTPRNALATCAWLDRTFNGDLLPLSSAVTGGRGHFGGISADAKAVVCGALTKIMHRTEPTGQMRLDWEDLNFAHVPVGLLSQVYERHAAAHQATARRNSVFYTPRTIAEYMVGEAFSALTKPARARVLDPAAGAGVFLVAAFRKLVEERWRTDGKRPRTSTIRQILNQQLAGFEINESALRLSALSLYLTALELDPDPQPVESLRFENLRDTVLFNVAGGDSPPYVTGSLGPAVGKEHLHRYDVVIGNPPWTSLRRDKSAKTYHRVIEDGARAAVAERLGTDRGAKFALPDDDPDIAFLWRATTWAKESGLIAFAMHGRLLFKQSGVGRAARRDVFDGLDVTGVLNGAAVRQTQVWPRVSAPFCLLFARNRPSTPDSTFYFVSLELEQRLNDRGRIRVDAKAAQVVQTRAAIQTPDLLKTLARGTVLDAAVLDKLRTGTTPLIRYWKEHALECGDGFQVGGKAGTQQSAEALHGLRVLTPENLPISYAVNPSRLPKFDSPTLLRTRRRGLYKGPLVLIAQAPDLSRQAPRASLVLKDVLFSETFIGFSCYGHPDADMLARYLFLLFNSNVPVYVALMCSGQFGVERDVYLVDDIKQQPFRPLELLSNVEKSEIVRLSDLLASSDVSTSEIDAWAAGVYGLNKFDQEVIEDTLAMASPSAESRAHAQMAPTRAKVASFAKRLCKELQPFFKKAGIETLTATVTQLSAGDPWAWITLSSGVSNETFARETATASADDLGATQVFACRRAAFDIGILAQNRYWTRSRARLLALDLLHREDVLRTLTAADE